MSRMLQALGFLQPQIMRDINVRRFFMAQGQRSSQIMDWQLNHMDRMHKLDLSRRKMSQCQSQETILRCSIMVFGMTI